MKTYIFTKKFYRRNNSGNYEMMDSRIMGVFTDETKAIEAAVKEVNFIHGEFGGIVTERSKFDNEVFDNTLEEDKNKIAFIVTEHMVA